MNHFNFFIKKRTNYFYLIFVLFCSNIHAQDSWTSFTYNLKIEASKKLKFKLSADIKVENIDKVAWGAIYARVDTKNEENGFFDNMGDRPVLSNEWKNYEINGYIDQNSTSLVFGGICISNGKFYFDNFELFIENIETGILEKTTISNHNFEDNTGNIKLSAWDTDFQRMTVDFEKGYAYNLVKDDTEKGYSLVIEGKNLKIDDSSLIGEREEYTPQIGTLVSMLNNLSDRVEYHVKNLDQRELDHLHDEKANSIGALIMHLAAAEKIYQLYTFENRGFNDEERKFWGPALNLDDAGRETYKGHDVEYYLKIYREVRAITLKELKKRDDSWLEITNATRESNNHYYWFHVMEHQSSHLGQILFLKKRIPPPPTINLENKKKID
ncbi:DinB family protein [uncultured Kordia sp.]|uniref:DinB family protein n=1 Tax=uncultured Kordia sp. TaxID=507699 RepID=UPI00261B78C0|nr:DinB family protein [uncultured Kordia sp.]